jgi:hypothetical protein
MTMISNAKIAVIAAVAALGIASPALAQSVTAGKTHNPHGARIIRTVPTRNHQVGDRGHQIYDFARVPSQQGSNADFPALRMDREDY